MKRFSKKFTSSSKWYLIIILLIAAIFRFYNFNNWLFFGMDQEYQALIAENIVSGRHFPFIGVNAADTGIYLGPFFSYFTAVIYAISGGNPLGWGFIASAIGVLVCYLVYRIGSEMFTKRIGLFAGFFMSGSFLVSFYDRKFWNPSLIPLFSLILGYLLYRIFNKDYRALIWWSLIFGLALQCHLSILIFLPLIAYSVWKKRRHFSGRIIFWSVFIFLLLQTPLVFFEIRHNFLNSKAILSIISMKEKQPTVSSSTLFQRDSLFLSSLGRFLWVPSAPDLFLESGQCESLLPFKKNAYPEGIILALLGIGSFIWWYKSKRRIRIDQIHYKKNISFPASFIIILFAVTFLVVQIYNRIFYEYYLLYLFPWLAIALGISADFYYKNEYGNMAVKIFLTLFLIFNFLTLFTSTFSYSYQEKMQAIRFIKERLKEDSYTLEAVGECSRFGGYRFLLGHFVGIPGKSYMDTYYQWLYHDSINRKGPEKIVLLSMIDPRDKEKVVAKWEEIKLWYLTQYNLLDKKIFQNIQVFLLKPKEL